MLQKVSIFGKEIFVRQILSLFTEELSDDDDISEDESDKEADTCTNTIEPIYSASGPSRAKNIVQKNGMLFISI